MWEFMQKNLLLLLRFFAVSGREKAEIHDASYFLKKKSP